MNSQTERSLSGFVLLVGGTMTSIYLGGLAQGGVADTGPSRTPKAINATGRITGIVVKPSPATAGFPVVVTIHGSGICHGVEVFIFTPGGQSIGRGKMNADFRRSGSSQMSLTPTEPGRPHVVVRADPRQCDGTAQTQLEVRPPDLTYRPTILSPAEGGQFVVGRPILLMVKPPEKDVLGTLLKITYQNWLCGSYDEREVNRDDPEREFLGRMGNFLTGSDPGNFTGYCWWKLAGEEFPVSVAEAQAGTYRLRLNNLTIRGRWRISVQRIEPMPLGLESPWRNFSLISTEQQTGPTKGPGPVFGR